MTEEEATHLQKENQDLREALEQAQDLLRVALRRIEELEKLKTPPPAFVKANVKKPADVPQHTLCERVERFLPELFVFVAIPGVPSHNNLAERSVRPLVVARKISGGNRSTRGSQTRMGLASLFGTWIAQKLNHFHQCLATLTLPSSLGQV